MILNCIINYFQLFNLFFFSINYKYNMHNLNGSDNFKKNKKMKSKERSIKSL